MSKRHLFSKLLFLIVSLQFLFASTMASEDEREPNTACPFSLKVVDYSIDFRPKDSQPYGTDIVQGTRVIIEAQARLYGNITKNNLTDLIAQFIFWCNDDGNNEYKNDKIDMLLLNISQPFVQDGQLMTDVSWNNSFGLKSLVPYNVTSCSAMAKVLGKNAYWMNATTGCGGKRCTCKVDNITDAVEGPLVEKRVWSLQDYFNEKQIKINEAQAKLDERLVFWTTAMVIVMGLELINSIMNTDRRNIDDEIKRKRLETIYAPLLLILRHVDESKDGIMGKKDIDKINVIIKENYSTLPSELITKWKKMFSNKSKRKVNRTVLREVIELVDTQHAKIANRWPAYYGEK